MYHKATLRDPKARKNHIKAPKIRIGTQIKQSTWKYAQELGLKWSTCLEQYIALVKKHGENPFHYISYIEQELGEAGKKILRLHERNQRLVLKYETKKKDS